MKIRPGTKIAIVGKSGSGKTSITYLLNRLYNCNWGSVLIDGYNIKNLNTEDLRKLVSIVTQKAIIANYSILYNVQYGL